MHTLLAILQTFLGWELRVLQGKTTYHLKTGWVPVSGEVENRGRIFKGCVFSWAKKEDMGDSLVKR